MAQSKRGPIPDEWFDGEVAPRPPEERKRQYSPEHHAELDAYTAELKKLQERVRAQQAPPKPPEGVP